jgi:hypothetical protein
MLVFTMSAFLFTLLVNGTTIRPILLALRLHIPNALERLQTITRRIYTLETEKHTLQLESFKNFDPKILKHITSEKTDEQNALYKKLAEVEDLDLFTRSLQIEILNIERYALVKLYELDRISQDTYFNFEAELDMQQDAREYPHIFEGAAGYLHKGKVKSRRSFRQSIFQLQRAAQTFPLLKSFLNKSEDDLISNRIGLLTARIVTSVEVFEFLRHMEILLGASRKLKSIISEEEKYHKHLIDKNQLELLDLAKKYPTQYEAFQEGHARQLIRTFSTSHA